MINSLSTFDNFDKFLHSYLYTTLFAVAIFALIFSFALILDYKTFRKIRTIQITHVALLVALGVVLNILGFYLGKLIGPRHEIRLGDSLLLLVGLLFGPILGIISGFCLDIISSLATGDIALYHFGFTVILCLYGFIGGLVFAGKNNKLWFLWFISGYTFIHFLAEVLLTAIFFPSTMGFDPFTSPSVFVVFAIKSAIEWIPIMIMLMLLSRISLELIQSRSVPAWCTRNGDISYPIIRKNIFKSKNKKDSKKEHTNIEY